jgi:pimeloyl-ACP methyl ester carboxylesterase
VSTPRFLDLPDRVVATRVPGGAQRELAALVADPPDGRRATPVLLVPGFTGSKEDFLSVLAPIAAAGHPVVAIDQRGQFESPGEDDPSAYDLKALAEDLLAVVAHLGQRVHLLGHSFGGLVARAAALAEPALVRSLTLMSSGPAAIPHPAASNLELISRALPVMDLEAIWAAKRQLEEPTETEPPTPEIAEFLRRRFLANSPTALLRFAEHLLTEQDRTAELAQLELPVLVAFGEDDDAWPPSVQADMADRLQARVASIEGAGHSPCVENPHATVSALVEFWATSGTAEPA